MTDIIMEIRKAIFTQQRHEILNHMIQCLERMSEELNGLDEEGKVSYLKSINLLNDYFVKGDLLAVSDVLKFDLLPLFNKGGVHEYLH